MPEPGYSASEDVTRHAAVDKRACQQMAQKYRWGLLRVEPISNPILSVYCVFRGRAEFPESYIEREDGNA